MIVNDPLRGADAEAMKNIVSTDPAEALYQDYLKARGGQCGVPGLIAIAVTCIG